MCIERWLTAKRRPSPISNERQLNLEKRSFRYRRRSLYLPQLLKKLGLSFHKAETTLIKRDSEKCRVWIQETLPEIYRKKIEAG
jgi:transposase